uniref:Uncharacterized protein n=1 Tax=Physcomitrium patens TaxID=3218 RepID=A0A2K1IM60_PHYPA|nr:hypothetical protein PHYPA_026683 [Physcomitrium patens]
MGKEPRKSPPRSESTQEMAEHWDGQYCPFNPAQNPAHVPSNNPGDDGDRGSYVIPMVIGAALVAIAIAFVFSAWRKK